MVSGNINSYARILNGPEQLESIKTYNQLAASMAVVRRERDERTVSAKEKKKQDEAEKLQRKHRSGGGGRNWRTRSGLVQFVKSMLERVWITCLDRKLISAGRY